MQSATAAATERLQTTKDVVAAWGADSTGAAAGAGGTSPSSSSFKAPDLPATAAAVSRVVDAWVRSRDQSRAEVQAVTAERDLARLSAERLKLDNEALVAKVDAMTRQLHVLRLDTKQRVEKARKSADAVKRQTEAAALRREQALKVRVERQQALVLKRKEAELEARLKKATAAAEAAASAAAAAASATPGGDCCVVCLDAPLEVLLQPCAHLCMCRGCADLMAVCPVCRKPTTGRTRVFAVGSK